MKIFEEFSLKAYNSYRIEAICKKAYFPETKEDIRELFHLKNEDLIILGGGYNVLLTKHYYDKSFVIFSPGHFGSIELIGDSEIVAEAGADLKLLSEFALENCLSGLEIYYDIPSSLGGAVVMNAGAGGEDIKALLTKVDYYDPTNDSFECIEAANMQFEYRNSYFQNNPKLIILKAYLKLQPGDCMAIQEKMNRTKDNRWAKQPRDYPNAGSVFKRPPGHFVGPMVEELGLKGFSIGGAKVSEKHAGFIVNFNNASGQDILELITYVKAKVKEAFNVELEVEQRII